MAEVTIIVQDPPSATVINNAQICNSDIDLGVILDFTSFASGSAGIWTETGGTLSGVDLNTLSNVDFTGVTPGLYEFTYTTNTAAPGCNEQSYILNVTVQDCACPGIVVNTGPHLVCNNGSTLDLTTLEIDTDPGSWMILSTPAGSNPAMIITNTFTVNNSDPGYLYFNL